MWSKILKSMYGDSGVTWLDVFNSGGSLSVKSSKWWKDLYSIEVVARSVSVSWFSSWFNEEDWK